MAPGETVNALNRIGVEAIERVTGQNPIPGGGFSAWHDRDAVATLLEPFGFTVEVHHRELAFTAESPAEYRERQFVAHPVGALAVPILEGGGAIDDVRSRTIALLERDNEDPAALRFTVPYVVVAAARR